MTTLQEFGRNRKMSLVQDEATVERRRYRRHDLERQAIHVERYDGKKGSSTPLGILVDLSSGGMRIRTRQTNIRPDQQIRLRVELPPFAGICPFVDTTQGSARPKNDWVGWMTVARVQERPNGELEVGGRLVGMDELDRGMLGLYLSTQPLAA